MRIMTKKDEKTREKPPASPPLPEHERSSDQFRSGALTPDAENTGELPQGLGAAFERTEKIDRDALMRMVEEDRQERENPADSGQPQRGSNDLSSPEPRREVQFIDHSTAQEWLRQVMLDDNLTTTDKVLLSTFLAFSEYASNAWVTHSLHIEPSPSKIMADLGIGKSTYYRALKNIKTTKYLIPVSSFEQNQGGTTERVTAYALSL